MKKDLLQQIEFENLNFELKGREKVNCCEAHTEQCHYLHDLAQRWTDHLRTC